MGLQYFNQEQFVSAILRGDALAVDLFITGAGVDINAPAQGTTPLTAAGEWRTTRDYCASEKCWCALT